MDCLGSLTESRSYGYFNEQGSFQVKELNFIQVFLRSVLGWYQETHLKTVGERAYAAILNPAFNARAEDAPQTLLRVLAKTDQYYKLKKTVQKFPSDWLSLHGSVSVKYNVDFSRVMNQYVLDSVEFEIVFQSRGEFGVPSGIEEKIQICFSRCQGIYFLADAKLESQKKFFRMDQTMRVGNAEQITNGFLLNIAQVANQSQDDLVVYARASDPITSKEVAYQTWGRRQPVHIQPLLPTPITECSDIDRNDEVAKSSWGWDRLIVRQTSGDPTTAWYHFNPDFMDRENHIRIPEPVSFNFLRKCPWKTRVVS